MNDIKNIESYLNNRGVDCIVSDFSQKINPIDIYKDLDMNLPFIIFTKNGTEELAFRSSQIGISDYININEHKNPEEELKTSVLSSISTKQKYIDNSKNMDLYSDKVTILKRVISDLSDVDSLDDALDIVINGFIDSFGYNLVGIWIKNDDILEPRAISDTAIDVIGSEQPNYKKGNSISWDAYEDNEIRIINNIKNEDNINNESTVIGSEAIIPIDEIGVINIASIEKNSFTREESEHMKLWAESVRTALLRIQRENDLRRNKEKLIKEKERMSNFVSFVTHDVRNPLQIAKGNLEIVRSDNDNSRIETAHESLERIDDIIDDIKILTEQREDKLNYENVKIQDLIRECWTNVKTEEADLINNVNLEVEADRSKLSNLFENIFKNSIRHGGSDIDIIVDNLNTGCGFYIQDTGCGIDENVIDSIFESGITTGNGGSGLGLKIVSEIVNIHNWSIDAENTSKGARFNVYTYEND